MLHAEETQGKHAHWTLIAAAVGDIWEQERLGSFFRRDYRGVLGVLLGKGVGGGGWAISILRLGHVPFGLLFQILGTTAASRLYMGPPLLEL